MSTIAILVALSALGVESGYEPATDGQLEYIVQIDPQLVPQLAKGQDITSELPRSLVIRHFRVTIGTGKLPHEGLDGRSTHNRLPTGGQGTGAAATGAPATGAQEPGIETQDVRVGYQPLDQGNGEFVIEITPTGLGDLDQHDLTGDIPAGLAISRVRISTQPGSAPGDSPPTSPPSFVPAPPAEQPVLAAAQQPVAAGQALDVPKAPASADQSAPPLEPLTPFEQSELAHPDASDPKFQYPPDPLAVPITSQPAGRKPAADSAPALGNPAPQDPPPRDQQPQGAGPADRHDHSGANRAAPAPLAADPHSAPLPGKNVTYSEQPPADQPATEHLAQKPSQAEKQLPGALKKAEGELELAEEELASATKSWPWFTLAVTLLLFLSIGGNLYMGWVAWDARNRCRSLLERFRAGELTLN